MSKDTAIIDLPSKVDVQWITQNQKKLFRSLKNQGLQLNCQELEKLNSVTLALFGNLQREAKEKNSSFIIQGLNENLKKELLKIPKDTSSEELKLESSGVFVNIGQGLENAVNGFKDHIYLLTESLYWSTFGLFKQKTILPGSTYFQMKFLGSSSLPIVLLLSFLIGLTLSIQSAHQLEQFNASIYLASGIGISMVTEIGPLMTAIIIAGRSGSAITAEISTMVVQDELRALQTMGIKPIQFLLLPRFWALSIMLPLLTVCADIIGIFSGFLISVLYCKIPIPLFFKELEWGVESHMIIQSLIKTLVFSWIITLISVYKGFTTKGGADAVGKATTACVVLSIFSIIVADAIFSFIFYF